MPTFNDTGSNHQTPGGAQGRRPGWRSLATASAALVLVILVPLLGSTEAISTTPIGPLTPGFMRRGNS